MSGCELDWSTSAVEVAALPAREKSERTRSTFAEDIATSISRRVRPDSTPCQPWA